MSLFLCCTGLSPMVQNKVQGTLGRVWGHSVVRVSDTYFLAVCNCGFTNTQRSSLFKRQITRLLVNPYLVFTTRKLPKRNRNSISLFLDLVSLALAYLHYLSYSSPLLRLTSS
ncbi:uncharacterized protein N7487_001351 [Penicillium crustosum]|uniref:uncharacterized protein n=1 Tax=Penicillium crustosum TaxID=36656 RepID=UPI002383D66D|nr:uncharacterized protein N7487_001351 [Penicillium crustosum]KAJ5417801.1 hypothetical protein N7487_001351 [Penicillium crustosum]